MGFTLRRFRPADAEPIAALTLAAIRVTGKRAYSPRQIAAWAASYSGKRLTDSAARGGVILVMADPADDPVAYAVLEANGHIDMLYCQPDCTGRGLAGQLLAEAERAARAMGVSLLHTDASEVARPVFERAGYALLRRRDFTIGPETAPVAIHNYAMEKVLG